MCAPNRRHFVVGTVASFAAGRAVAAPPQHELFVKAAFAMRARAVESGDQAYGAVIVRNGDLIGAGPSRVIMKNDPNAHAEREAIKDAQAAMNRTDLSDCLMYSTSRPCQDCERAAAQARIARMYFGRDAADGGAPQLR
ncbi:MAG: hypothetical protein JO245_13435 [Pseudolabrys sp.]|nr:hypothetical protein [Pseudolabrys sp.]